MNIVRKILGLLLIAAAVSGCTGQPVKISSVIDPKTVDMKKGRPIYAEAGGFQLFSFIPINVNSRQVRAYEELQRVAGRDAIADVTVTEAWTYAYVGTIYWTEMKAIAYPKISPASAR